MNNEDGGQQAWLDSVPIRMQIRFHYIVKLWNEFAWWKNTPAFNSVCFRRRGLIFLVYAYPHSVELAMYDLFDLLYGLVPHRAYPDWPRCEIHPELDFESAPRYDAIYDYADYYVLEAAKRSLVRAVRMKTVELPSACEVIKSWWLRCHYHPKGAHGRVIEADFVELKKRSRSRALSPSPPTKRQKHV